MSTSPALVEQIALYLRKIGVNANITDHTPAIYIEPSTLNNPKYAGLQIIGDLRTNEWEYSEHNAGKHENELHLFGTYKSFKVACNQLLKPKPKKKTVYH